MADLTDLFGAGTTKDTRRSRVQEIGASSALGQLFTPGVTRSDVDTIMRDARRRQEEQRKKREEEERKRREREQQAQESRQKAEEKVKQKEQEMKVDAETQERRSVFEEDTVIRQATDEEVSRSKKAPGFLEKLKNWAYEMVPFADKVLDEPQAKGSNDIRTTLKRQEQARENIKQQKIQNLGGNEGTGEVVRESLQSGLLGSASILQATGSVIARKAGAEKLAGKLDLNSRRNREHKRIFDEEYRKFFVSDEYNTYEKLRSDPVRLIAGLIGETAPTFGAVATGGAAATYLGAPVAVATGTAVGIGSLFSFGSAYQDAREFGLSEEEAEKIGFMTALFTAPLEAIPEWRLFSKLGGKGVSQTIQRSYTKNITSEILRRGTSGSRTFIEQGTLETMTEVPQTIVENAWARTYNENRDLFEGVEEAALAGFFSGGMMDVLVSTTYSIGNGVREATGQPASQHGVNGLYIEEIEQETIQFVPPSEDGVVEQAQDIAETVAEVSQREQQEAQQAQQVTRPQEQREGEADDQFAQRFTQENPDQMRKNYLQRVKEEFKHENVVSADEAKFAIPGFSSTKSAAYHEPASAFSKQYATELLARKDTADKPVLILAGGSGAGKSSGLQLSVEKYGRDLDSYALVHDTNVSKLAGGVERIEAALESGRRVVVQYTWRDPIESFVNGVIPRVKTKGRIVPIDIHVENHIGARKTISQLVEKYGGGDEVLFRFVDNSNGKGKTKLIRFADLPEMPYTEDVLKRRLYDEAVKAQQKGEITAQELATLTEGIKQAGRQPSTSDGRRTEQSGGEQIAATAGESDGGVEASLMAEASKYKTAEEFVKAQPTLYHGTITGSRFDTFDLGKARQGVGGGALTQGNEIAYFSKDRSGAEILSKAANERNFLRTATPETIAKTSDQPVGEVLEFSLKPNTKIKQWTAKQSPNTDDIAKLKVEGFDGVEFRDTVAYDGLLEGRTSQFPKLRDDTTIAVWNADKIISKSQLTDIWEKANEPEGSKVVEQAREITNNEKQRSRSTGEGITRTSGLASSVKEIAIRKRITQAFEDLPEFETVNLKEQAKKAHALLNEDYPRAKAIALGQEDPPSGVRALSVFKAVEAQAIQDRDAITMRDLATYSTVPYQLSVAAQEVGLARGRDDSSPVTAIRSIAKERENAVKKQLKGKSVNKVKNEIVNELKQSIKKTKPNKDAWLEFVKEIRC